MSKTYFNISDKLRLYEFDGMLDQYGDAAAAYSLRKLRNGYTGDAIRVRRSSDNTERDMGFYNNELDTVALLDWVNEEYIYYESDFRASNPYSNGIALLTPIVGESIDGVDDAIKLILTGGSGIHGIVPFSNVTSITGQEFRLEFDYYIPSTNIAVDNILTFNTFGSISSTTDNFNVLDEWTSVIITGITVDLPGNVDLFFRPRTGTSQTIDADGDVFYLKNIRVTQLTADGHVHTWYDQSANANHAVQGTATAQPKIVDAGTLVVSGSKPSLKFDGVDDFYQPLPSANYSQPYTLATVFNYNALQSFDFVLSGSAAQSLGSDGSGNHRIYAGVNLLNGTTDLTQKSHFAMYNGTASQYSVNGNNVIGDAGTIILYALLIGKRGGGATAPLADANISEVLVYNTNESANRENIEISMNNHYNLY